MRFFDNDLTGLKNAKKSRCIYFALFFTLLFFLSFFFQLIFTFGITHGAQQRTAEDVLNIRADAGMEYEILGVIEPYCVFDVYEEKADREGNSWVFVDHNGYRGYVLAENTLEVTEQGSDESDDPEEDKEMDPGQDEDEDPAWQPEWSGRIQSEAEFEAQLQNFPESYHAGLRSVHARYPNYSFTADHIHMDFEELVDAQIGKKVSAFYASSWKAMYDESFGYFENYDWDTGEWMNSEGDFTYASRETIAHFIDPRNFLDPDDIYMFMRQSYSDTQTIDDLRSIIAGSFLSEGYIPDEEENDQRLNGDYAAVIMEAAAISGSSPYVLAASILLEQGFYGGTPLISGYYEANDGTVYDGWYNYFDIGATGSDHDNVIRNGLEYAIGQGWNSRYLSIVDGAIWITDSYINNGQDTYYYKEFNVINGWDELWHQYSTGVMTAYSSAGLLRNTLSGNDYAALDFRIPVYDNMPADPAQEPVYNDHLNNYYFADMQASGLEPEFSMSNRNYTMTVTGDAVINIAVPEWAEYEGEHSYELQPGYNMVSLDVRSQTGYLRTYEIEITSSGEYVLTVNTMEGNRLRICDGPEEDFIRGDANGDHKISSLDYIAIKNHIMEYVVIVDRIRLYAADTNDDGRISALDYIAVKNLLMNQ